MCRIKFLYDPFAIAFPAKCGRFPFSHSRLFGPGESETDASVGDEGERVPEEEHPTDDECLSALAWEWLSLVPHLSY